MLVAEGDVEDGAGARRVEPSWMVSKQSLGNTVASRLTCGNYSQRNPD